MAHGRFDNPVIATLAGVKDFFRKQSLSGRLKNSDSAEGKTILITGANSGLGYGLSVDFAKRKGHVIMACRSQIPEAGEKVKKASGSELVEMRFVDLSKIESIHDFCRSLEEDNIKIDILILNAGVALPGSRKTDSGLEEMFLVNYLSNVILVSRLLKSEIIVSRGQPGIGKPRIIFISSDSHQGSSYVDYEQFGKYESYGISKGMNYYSYYKLVLNTYATQLSRILNNNGEYNVGVHVICPGPVNSNIVKEAPWLLRKVLKGIFFIIFKSPEEAAKPVVYMSLSEDYEGKSNEYLHMFNAKKMDEKVYILEEGKKLWDKTSELWIQYDTEAEKYSLG